METHEPVIGYFKVFTTDPLVADLDSFDGPPRKRPGRTITQWIYPYTAGSRDAAQAAAERKADHVRTQIPFSRVTFGVVQDVPRAYAFRVVLPSSQ